MPIEIIGDYVRVPDEFKSHNITIIGGEAAAKHLDFHKGSWTDVVCRANMVNGKPVFPMWSQAECFMDRRRFYQNKVSLGTYLQRGPRAKVDTRTSAAFVIQCAEEEGQFVFDIETAGPRLLCIAFAFLEKPWEGFVVDGKDCGSLREIFENPRLVKIGHNIVGFDILWLRKHLNWNVVGPFEDTRVGFHTIVDSALPQNLGYLGSLVAPQLGPWKNAHKSANED